MRQHRLSPAQRSFNGNAAATLLKVIGTSVEEWSAVRAEILTRFK